ncbi:hypothetical protein OH76DRAFT_1442708 [Lentinus brumalis]|uniref:Uncharacterized protein n=1 Tax=Lentinus brumalis TaxID=2498619 RepID=A0A371D2P8_9APHY|nr:hypothetical protein OH76DRAFT_1442708 [Polyporus brumalis]
MKVSRFPEQRARAEESAKAAGAAEYVRANATLNLKEHGLVPEPVRALVRDLVELGLKVNQINGAISAVAQATGTAVAGSLSARSIGRFVREGGVAAAMQIVDEIRTAQSLTISGDGTTNKHVNYDSRHLYVHENGSHLRRFLGINSAPNHTSETQLNGWEEMMDDFHQIYNDSPRGLATPADARLFPTKVTGILTDHAEDQKKLVRLFAARKKICDRILRGERVLKGTPEEHFHYLISEETHAALERLGGPDAWAELLPEQLDVETTRIREAVVMRLGEDDYAQLSEEERELVDLFVHAGCCMHKELNSVKGGNARMVAFWAAAGHEGPVLLMNKDNEAAAAAGASAAKTRAVETSRGGGVKLAELAGALLRHKDDKKGQQDSYRFFFEQRLGRRMTFPDTSNTRYQSYCEAAGELVLHLELYRQFLEHLRDKKDSGRFNHLEQNIYKGLRDDGTITELCVLALYGQVISHPYTRQIRGPEVDSTNHLDLGPLHQRLKNHIARLIADPDLILGPDASHDTAVLDAQPWNNPDIVSAIRMVAPTLPHLRGALVAFLEGALETWERFTVDFAPDGVFAKLSPALRERAWMPSTNDANEGALGGLRVNFRSTPNISIHQYNSRLMYKLNDTSTYIATVLNTPEGEEFMRRKAREIDASGRERKRRRDVAEADQRAAKRRKEDREERREKANQRLQTLAQLTPILDLAELTWEKTTVRLLESQLDWHRTFVDTGPKDDKKIPMKKDLHIKLLKLGALVDAVTRYNEAPPALTPANLVAKILAASVGEDVEGSGDDSDLEMEQE